MQPMELTAAVLERFLDREWGLRDAALEPHDGGMNSRTWFVTDPRGRFVAKAVPTDAGARFSAGLAVASLVQGAGIPAGAPIRSLGGDDVVHLDGWTLALLTFVPGSPLDGEDESERRLMGSVLARAHAALVGGDVAGAGRFHWIDAGAEHLRVRDWVRPAVLDALDGWERLPPSSLTWGLLHTDPAPEAFLLDGGSGICGLIDWDMGIVGPLMYDVASAVMYVGGPSFASPLLRAYLDGGPLDRREVEHSLEPMLRLRWAVQADYFARRISTNDLTGIGDPRDNETGLDDARRALLAR